MEDSSSTTSTRRRAAIVSVGMISPRARGYVFTSCCGQHSLVRVRSGDQKKSRPYI
ncbi:hypothetical protein SAMN05444167_2304 [Terriglobus roseus]|uniref:Uncharacterized protein n=1 Tax=Terriglobus roseus TaxID=392734 RepID=A0A1G7KTX8_9BACT|nr:hypothetical protein SAMN05444167_2304 [Terriglobus roseus]